MSRRPSPPPLSDPANIAWRRRPAAESASIRRAAAVAADWLGVRGPPPAGTDWVLWVHAAATGPTMPDHTWAIEESVDGRRLTSGPGITLELTERDTLIRRLATDDPALVAEIKRFPRPFVLVLLERDGEGVSVCECRMHLLTPPGGRA